MNRPVPSPDKTEQVLQEFDFLYGNAKWSGKVQVLRVTVAGENGGPPRKFINKRLVINSTGRYINLPRAGIEEVVSAILAASDSERQYHEALLEEINNRPHSGGRDRSPRGHGR